MKPYFNSLTSTGVRVGRISYMNVAPVYYGLNQDDKPSWMNMICAPPSDLNKMLADNKLDISPVSSAAYARNQDKWLLIPNLSIACFGKVMSVLLVSKYPFEKLNGKTIILTRESATAAALSRYLFASQNIKPHIKTGKIFCACDIDENTDAALVIGDAALKEKWTSYFKYVWDLGQMWQEWTNLPFVFALWGVRKSFAQENPEWVLAVMDKFYESKAAGKKNIYQILPQAAKKLGISINTCRKYYKTLDYDLNSMQIKGLKRFFNGLYHENIIPKKVNLSFFQNHSEIYSRNNAA